LQFAGTEALISSVIDLIPQEWKPRKFEREIISLIVCLVLFSISVIFVTQVWNCTFGIKHCLSYFSIVTRVSISVYLFRAKLPESKLGKSQG